MESLSLQEVLNATGGAVVGPSPGSDFRRIATDSRAVAPADLFVALRGPHHDAHQFVGEARRAGARGALISDPSLQIVSSRDFVVIRVADTGRALLDLARYYRSRFSARVIAITGSNGKTTTKDLLGCLLKEPFKTSDLPPDHSPVVVSERSYNNHVGLPLTLFRMDRETRRAVVEIGTNAPGEVADLAAVARPEVGVITNVSESHLAGLGDIEGVLQEKASLLDALPADGLAVINADDPSAEVLRRRAPCEVVTFGVVHHADFMALDVKCSLRGLTFRLNGESRILVHLTGCHNVYNSLAALAVARRLGVTPDMCRRALNGFDRPPSRMKPVPVGKLLILDDSFNANPGSVEAAIKTMSVLSVRGRRVLILGDMKELGTHTEKLHRRIGQLIHGDAFDLVVTVGQESRVILEEAAQRGLDADSLHHFLDAGEAAAVVADLLCPEDTILVKGSRALRMERIVDAILTSNPFPVTTDEPSADDAQVTEPGLRSSETRELSLDRPLQLGGGASA